MRVRLIQSGGLLGIVRECEVDSSTLAPEAAAELERLVRAGGLSASGTFLSSAARDLQQYEITIEDESGTLFVVFDDASVPPEVRPILVFLKSRARPRPPG